MAVRTHTFLFSDIVGFTRLTATRGEPLEEPSFQTPKRTNIWAAGPLTSVASLFAAQLRVAMQPNEPCWRMQEAQRNEPASSAKNAAARPAGDPALPNLTSWTRRLSG